MLIERYDIEMRQPIYFNASDSASTWAYTQTDSTGFDFMINGGNNHTMTFDIRMTNSSGNFSGGMSQYNNGTILRVEDDRVKIYKQLDIRDPVTTAPSTFSWSNWWQGMSMPSGWFQIMINGGTYKVPVWS